MNVLVFELATQGNTGLGLISRDEIVVEDNVGEAIHIHWRNLRLEMSVDDFQTFADELTAAREEVVDGNR